MKTKNENNEYKGDLKGFPKEVVDWMLDQQEKQGNKRDVSVFEKDKNAGKDIGGFTWSDTEDYVFCYDVIVNDRFDLFFERFPKKEELEEEPKYRYFIIFYKTELGTGMSVVVNESYPSFKYIEKCIKDNNKGHSDLTLTGITELSKEDYENFIS